MTSDRSDGTEQTAGASRRETQQIEWTAKFDPTLRTDKRVLGSVIVFFLLFVAVFGYSSGEYPLSVTGGLLAFAFLIVLLLVPYKTLREAW